MSDPKRATLITVGAPKSEKNKVNKTVRLTINLDESNESKYPELNYKELVIAEEKLRKKKVENGKTDGLNPFSDNDEDVERVARKFEQKYGSYKTTYGRKGRSKHDDFADIGAGYDENDSFIDNTGGYDEMIPPDYDTFYGGFYINCGSLEFKNVDGHGAISDGEPGAGRRNKRRLSSSSSEEDSSDSSSDSESAGEKDPKVIANGAVDSHKTEHRKKKNKNIDKKKAKKIRRTDSSAATSGKQTSDDNGHADSGDSRTSQSDSLTSKPAPSSENAITSDSSRDIEAKVDVKLPPQVVQVIEELEAVISRQLMENPNTPNKEMESKTEQYIVRLERVLQSGGCEPPLVRAAWMRASRALATPRTKLLQRAKAHTAAPSAHAHSAPQASMAHTASLPATSTAAASHKRKQDNDPDDVDFSRLTDQEREAKIVETLQRLKALIDERKPGMMANYNAECERVQEERKKIQIASAAEGAPMVEKRLPKRRFPWCPRSRALLGRLTRLAGDQDAAAVLLAKRALPLFPSGFVRMPTLLRQADLSKEIKVDMKRQRVGSTSQPAMQSTQPVSFMEPIQFPSSLTVTTMKTSPEKCEVTIVNENKDKYKSSLFGSIINSFSLSKELVVETQEDRRKDSVIVEKKDEVYIPPNNIGSITITPVPNSQPKEKKLTNANATDKQKEGLIRVKSPAVLNAEMVNINKKEKEKALENIHKREKDVHKKPENKHKEKRADSPLHIDTSYQPKQKEPTPSPKNKVEENQKQIEKISQKQIENMRVAENNIPRPALVPVHHSPTFAKPDKRPPEVKKKKEIVIVSDLDPLGDVQQEPLAIDDSSSDVEVVEDNKCEKPSEKSDSVPLSDKVSVENHKKADGVRLGTVSKDRKEERKESLDDATKVDFDSLMQNIRDLEHSQESPKFNSNTYSGVITSAKHAKSSSQSAYSPRSSIFGESRSDKDKFTERTSLNKMDGCSAITGDTPKNTVELL